MELQKHWDLGQLPDIGDLCFSDGRVFIFNESCCSDLFTFTEKKYEGFGLHGDEIEVTARTVNPDNGHIAYRGSGGMGNNGFVAYFDEENNIIWSMSLDFSNPFIDLKFAGDNILATTEIDYEFTIPVKFPEKMSCISRNEWGY